MNIKLINEPNPHFTAIQQILYNRGIKDTDEMKKYIFSTDECINDPILFGEAIQRGIVVLAYHLAHGSKILIIVDADCDGFTSSAEILNFLYHYFPATVINNISWFIHDGKQHGLKDCIETALKYDLVICPDSASNDYEEHQRLSKENIDCLILDHHEVEHGISPYAIVVNNQCSDYPNKFLSGVGVTWQFCRLFERVYMPGQHYTDKLLDLVALGNTADMMSLLSIETKHLINKGFEPDNVVNPFVYGMWMKNEYKLGDHITSWGAAFYIAPLVNAIVRSGSQEDKELVFSSMLTFKANEQILSNKRGHKPGEMETVLAQALRACTNVKNHQTKAEKEGLELLEHRIEEEHMLDHRVLLFKLEPGQIHPNIAGLVANRIMGKYQRPVCVLTHNGDIYAGSARGCDITDITEFKSICSRTGLVEFVAGHEGAFGIAIKEDNIEDFLKRTDEILQFTPTEACYRVDYLWEGDKVDGQIIEDISGFGHLWGKDVFESKVGIKNLKITADMITLKSPDKNPTICITLEDCEIIKFGSSQEEYEKLKSENGFITINLVGTCGKNEWNGRVTPQIMLEDYEIVNSSKYYF